VEEFNILIQEGIGINVKDQNGLTPLLYLLQNKKETGDVEGIVRFLIQIELTSIQRTKRGEMLSKCSAQIRNQNYFLP
jgi:hypothetical protein